MIYNAPTKDNIPQWVPIVVKNKDFLIGYIKGKLLFEDLLSDILNANDINIEFGSIDLCLDSTRFNDVLENGKRESEMSSKELKEYIDDMVKQRVDYLNNKHPDNGENVFGEYFLRLDCVCNLGTYIFETEDDVPENNLCCEFCQRVLIDYTGIDDDDFDYDGEENSKRGESDED